jgi:hypothetical protein
VGIYDGDHIIVNTGPGNDNVRVRVDPTTGGQIVTLNGTDYYFPAGADIVIRAGDSNDTITVAPGTRVHITVLGGEGQRCHPRRGRQRNPPRPRRARPGVRRGRR